jgi:hypothetical protein
MPDTKLNMSAPGAATSKAYTRSSIVNIEVSQKPEMNLEQYNLDLQQAVKNMNSYPSNFIHRVYDGIVRTLSGNEE